MKTLLLTGSNNKMFEILDLTLESKIKYCSVHGYDLLIKKQWLPSKEVNFTINNIGFLRVFYALQMLSIYDCVMWIDADAFITNFNYKIENIADSDHCFFVSCDWHFKQENHDSPFNTGNFIVKKSKNINSFTESFINTAQSFLSNDLQEQQTINHMYFNKIQNESIRKVDKKYLNSVPELMHETQTWQGRPAIQEPWTKDSFIAHLTGAKNHERIAIFKKMQSFLN